MSGARTFISFGRKQKKIKKKFVGVGIYFNQTNLTTEIKLIQKQKRKKIRRKINKEILFEWHVIK